VLALLTGGRRTATVAPVSTVADSSYDDDSAARVARAAAGAAPHPGTVPPA